MALLGLLVVDQGQVVSGGVLNALLLLNPTDAYRLFNLTGSGNVSAFSGMAGVAQTTTLSPSVLLAALAAWALLPLGARRRSPSPGESYEKASPSSPPLAGALALAGCNDEKTAEAPPPPQRADGRGDRPLLRHERARAPRARRDRSSWRAARSRSGSRRPATRSPSRMLPEEPKDIRAIYVSDMAKAPSWDKPGANNWVDAKQASFVIGSRDAGRHGRRRGGAVLRQGCCGKVRRRERRTRRGLRRGAEGLRPGRHRGDDGFRRTAPDSADQHHGHAAPVTKDGHAH